MRTRQYEPGDKVWFRGEFAEQFTIRGMVETVPDTGTERIGVRLENGNFKWCLRDQITARAEGGRPMDLAEIARSLVVCESPDGWSLHAPESTNEQIASGDAPYLLSGPWSYDPDGDRHGPSMMDRLGAAERLIRRRNNEQT